MNSFFEDITDKNKVPGSEEALSGNAVAHAYIEYIYDMYTDVYNRTSRCIDLNPMDRAFNRLVKTGFYQHLLAVSSGLTIDERQDVLEVTNAVLNTTYGYLKILNNSHVLTTEEEKVIYNNLKTATSNLIELLFID